MEKSIGEIVIVDSHQGGKVEKLRSRMRLFSEILQCVSQSDDVAEILQTFVDKLLNCLNVFHVSIFALDQQLVKKLDGLEKPKIAERMSGRIVAEAIAQNCDICSQSDIENILKNEHGWIQSTKKEIFDLYAAELTQCELKLSEIFAGKAYLLVPVILRESNQEDCLWGFLTVHNCSATNSEPSKSSWDQDDVLLLQQVAMQIEIILHQENRNIRDFQQSKESELKFKAIFNNTFQFVCLLSLDGILLEVNQAALDFGGITRDEVIGKPAWGTQGLSHSEALKKLVQQSVKESAEGKFIRYEIDIPVASGKIVTIDFSLRPLKDESGKVILLILEGRDITDLKAIEQNLRKNEAMLLEAQQIAKLGNWQWNVADDDIMWSPELFKIFGVDPRLGTPNYEEHLLNFVEEDRKKLNLAVQQAVSNGDSYHLELQIKHSDQSYRYVTAIGHAEYDNNGQVSRLYGTVQDITDHKLIEQNLKKSEARLIEAQRIAKLGNWQWDLLSDEIIGSDEFFNILGRDPALGGFSYEEVAPVFVQEDRESLDLAIDRARNYGESYCRELRIPQPDNSYRYLEAIGHAEVCPNGEIIRLYGTLQDISDRKKIEAKIESTRLSEATIQAKSEFLAVMSHELRTPVNAVIGMTEIFGSTPLSTEQQQYLATIRQGGEILLSVVNNVLDFSRIESGHFALEHSPFNLQQCVDEVLELVTARITEKSLELSVLISSDVPSEIMGDHMRLRQILINLVSNAIKFTETGEIVVTVHAKLNIPQPNNYELSFSVRDTGIGIAIEDLGKLFKSFSQANNSIARQYGGTGLGLVICKQLCELMGGTISVNSTIGEGSTFSFSIMANAITKPSKDAAQDDESVAEDILENLSELCEREVNLGGKRILLVCNNANIGQAIAMYTQAWQISTQISKSASDAMLLFESANFDAVLIDENLVDIDALELANDIHQIFPDLKLVLLTFVKVNVNESAFEKSLEKAFESTKMNSAKFAAYINKPITSSKLYQTLINIFYPKQAKSIPDSPNSANNSASNPSTPEQVTTKEIPLSVLIVEDNLINQQLLLKMLKRLGYQVEVVSNGQKAVEAVTQKNYEIIFMDLQMPIMDGLTATTHIRQLPNRQPWIIGLSANSFAESHKSALAVGMDEYLTKPLAPEDLSTALIRVAQTFAKDVLQISPQLNIKIPPQTCTKKNPPKLDSSSINLGIFKSIENSVGKENLSEVINNYFNQAEREIAIMRHAFTNQDIVTLEANNHSLKGGSGLFGATQLLKLCRSLQFMCKICIESNEQAIDDIEQIGIVLQNIEEEYDLVKQALKALQ